MTRWMSLGVVLFVLPLAGCGKKWSPACKSEASLAAPFSALNLPVGEGRVCESDDKKARLEFQGGDKDKWKSAVEQAVTGAGFAKDSCPSYCMYTKGTQRLQVIVSSIGTKWVTASLIMSTGRDTSEGGGSDKKGAVPAAASAAAAATGASDLDSIPECKSYFTKLQACPPAKGSVSRQEEANIKRRELQEKLTKGSRVEIIRKTCETFEKLLKCS